MNKNSDKYFTYIYPYMHGDVDGMLYQFDLYKIC